MNYVVSFYAAATKTASENSASVRTTHFKKARLDVDVTAASGTTPTLVIEVQTSYDGTEWFPAATLTDKERQGSLTRLTAPTDEAKITVVGNYTCEIDNLSDYARLALTITGTTPSFTFTAKVTFYG